MNFFFMIDDWSLISLKESKIRGTWVMKNIVSIQLRLVWVIRSI